MHVLSVPVIVLDTNVVLDWLVFRDPACHAVASAIEQRLVRWTAAAGMREEFDEVVNRGVGASRQPDRASIAQTWRRHAEMREIGTHTSTVHFASIRCRCSDPDDQPFIDLALQCGARWLLSRDRAVLHLAAEARRSGLEIITPARWSLPSAPD